MEIPTPSLHICKVQAIATEPLPQPTLVPPHPTVSCMSWCPGNGRCAHQLVELHPRIRPQWGTSRGFLYSIWIESHDPIFRLLPHYSHSPHIPSPTLGLLYLWGKSNLMPLLFLVPGQRAFQEGSRTGDWTEIVTFVWLVTLAFLNFHDCTTVGTISFIYQWFSSPMSIQPSSAWAGRRGWVVFTPGILDWILTAYPFPLSVYLIPRISSVWSLKCFPTKLYSQWVQLRLYLVSNAIFNGKKYWKQS